MATRILYYNIIVCTRYKSRGFVTEMFVLTCAMIGVAADGMRAIFFFFFLNSSSPRRNHCPPVLPLSSGARGQNPKHNNARKFPWVIGVGVLAN